MRARHCGAQLIAMKANRDGHTFERGNADAKLGTQQPVGDGPAHHMLHHTKNVGNLSTEPLDRLFGTLIDSTKISALVLPHVE